MKSKDERYELIQRVGKLLAADAEDADIGSTYAVLGEYGGYAWYFCRNCAEKVADALNGGKSLDDLTYAYGYCWEGSEPEGEAYAACDDEGDSDGLECCCKCGMFLDTHINEDGVAVELNEVYWSRNANDSMSAYILCQCFNNLNFAAPPELFDLAYSIARCEYRRRVGILAPAWRLVYWVREKWLVWRERVKVRRMMREYERDAGNARKVAGLKGKGLSPIARALLAKNN